MKKLIMYLKRLFGMNKRVFYTYVARPRKEYYDQRVGLETYLSGYLYTADNIDQEMERFNETAAGMVAIGKVKVIVPACMEVSTVTIASKKVESPDGEVVYENSPTFVLVE